MSSFSNELLNESFYLRARHGVAVSAVAPDFSGRAGVLPCGDLRHVEKFRTLLCTGVGLKWRELCGVSDGGCAQLWGKALCVSDANTEGKHGPYGADQGFP